MTLLGVDPKHSKSTNHRNICSEMFVIALFTTAKLWKQPRLLFQQQNNSLRKCGRFHIKKFFSTIQKNIVISVVRQLIKLNQSQKNKNVFCHCLFYVAYAQIHGRKEEKNVRVQKHLAGMQGRVGVWGKIVST